MLWALFLIIFAWKWLKTMVITRLCSTNTRSSNEISKYMWFRSCLKAWFFWVGPLKGEQHPAAVTVILWNGYALICWQLQGKQDIALQTLTLWELGYDRFVLWNSPKTSSCRLPYQHHSSSANCAGELFKGSNRSASHPCCTKKIFVVGGCGFFVVTS